MKRLGRWLFNLASIVSGILCIATLGIWLVTLWTGLWIGCDGRKFSFSVNSERNLLRARIDFDDPRPLRILGWRAGSKAGETHGFRSELDGLGGQGLPRLGIAYRRGEYAGGPFRNPMYTGTEHAIYVPHWLLFLITTVIPCAWILRFHRTWKIAQRGACPACGYDLRATPERCPECGRIPAAAKGMAP